MPDQTKTTDNLIASRGTFATRCEEFATSYNGANYFRDVAEFLAREANVAYVLIGHPSRDNSNYIDTVALFAKGSIVPNISYHLNGTPCENVMGRNCCYFPSGIQKMFPADKELEELGIESYIGYPVFNSAKEAVGLIVLMDTEMIPLAGALEEGLRQLADRTALELSKLQQLFSNN